MDRLSRTSVEQCSSLVSTLCRYSRYSDAGYSVRYQVFRIRLAAIECHEDSRFVDIIDARVVQDFERSERVLRRWTGHVGLTLGVVTYQYLHA